jgi:hypothetical protein
MNKYTIIPSNLKYKGSPSVDEKVSVSLDQTSQQITQYDRSVTISLAQVYDNERQGCTVFRPTFKVNYLYSQCSQIVINVDFKSFQLGMYYNLMFPDIPNVPVLLFKITNNHKKYG